MFCFNFIARIFYLEIVRHTIMFLYRPHLIIYLDVPVNDTIQNIKKRNIPHEVNSKALTSEFHHQMALQYRNFYIPEARYFLVTFNLILILIAFILFYFSRIRNKKRNVIIQYTHVSFIHSDYN